jgi:hypothetical protein
MHGGSGVVASVLLFTVCINIFAAMFIVVVGAPGLFRTWRRWVTGLSLVVLASALTATYLLIRPTLRAAEAGLQSFKKEGAEPDVYTRGDARGEEGLLIGHRADQSSHTSDSNPAGECPLIWKNELRDKLEDVAGGGPSVVLGQDCWEGHRIFIFGVNRSTYCYYENARLIGVDHRGHTYNSAYRWGITPHHCLENWRISH